MAIGSIKWSAITPARTLPPLARKCLVLWDWRTPRYFTEKTLNLKKFKEFSNNGNEVVGHTIGNASTSEGMFWETVNAIGVLHAPAIISVYDDGYGISVPNEFQMVKESIYMITKGFERIPCPAVECDRGYDLYQVHAWDYPGLLDTFEQAADQARKFHIPALIHITEATQPQGHSTSGSQERYKSKERLEWEAEFDCLRMYRLWLIDNKVATTEQLTAWEKEDKLTVEKARKSAWEAFQAPMRTVRKTALEKIAALSSVSSKSKEIAPLTDALANQQDLFFKSTAETTYKVLTLTRGETSPERDAVLTAYNSLETDRRSYYDRFLLSDSVHSPFKVPVVPAKFSDDSPMLQGFEVLNKAFDLMLAREPRMVIFGEDVGHLGDVNQGLKGMQEKYGPLRVTDTGIREATILGQGIGLALRGLRPIAEIQYLDYLLYALQIMADDLSNLRWRTAGRQQAPVIVRTRGHRLEGIFHAGSPMAGIINLVRGMHVLVPRNLTQAAGFYNTLIQSDDPAIVVESLNGYRLRERLPDNIGEFTVPIGIPEIITQGKDLTIVSYGSTLRIVHEAVKQLANLGVEAELIDVQTLLPFDINNMIVESLKKTNRILFVDEDVPGGTTAYMLQNVLEKQGGYAYLDSAPVTLPAGDYRPAYADDGDYYSKPNIETIIDAAYGIMRESAFPLPGNSIGGKMATKLIAPRPGEGVEELVISAWLKIEGDAVEEMESIVEVETDKVVTEIPSPVSGTLLKIYVPQGQSVKVGEAMALIGNPGELEESKPAPEPVKEAEAVAAPAQPEETRGSSRCRARKAGQHRYPPLVQPYSLPVWLSVCWRKISWIRRKLKGPVPKDE